MGSADGPGGHGDGPRGQPEPQPGLAHLGVPADGERDREGHLQVLAAVESGDDRDVVIVLNRTALSWDKGPRPLGSEPFVRHPLMS